jgi:hypothetical protein
VDNPLRECGPVVLIQQSFGQRLVLIVFLQTVFKVAVAAPYHSQPPLESVQRLEPAHIV